MTNAQGSPKPEGPRHLLFFDGVCGFCDRLVRFILDRDREGLFRFAPLQGDTARRELARFHRDAGALDTVYALADARRAGELLYWRSRAILFVLGELGWPWRAAGALGCLPASWLDAAYDGFARVRYRVFGRLDRCRVPSAAERERFVDHFPSNTLE